MVGVYPNTLLDEYKNQVLPVFPTDLERVDPDQLLARLDEIQSPRDRLIAFYRSLSNFADPPTHEAKLVQRFTILGTLASAFVGGILKSPDIHQEYVMKHNTSVFETHYRGNRHFWDTLITQVAAKGIRYGVRSFFFCGFSTLIATSSVVYRNRPSLLDHVVGFTAFGAISRLWLGPRAMLVGGFVGSMVGTVIYGSLRATELTLGVSLAELRYLEKKKYTDDKELLLRERMILKEKDHFENLEKGPRF